jgi:RNA polymerase sigma factor (sigma-70 family)
MGLYEQDSRSKRSRKRPRAVGAIGPRAGDARGLGRERVGETLGEWQGRELRIARGFAECRGLSTERLEDIYQETAVALLTQPYASEEHLRNALRHGIKHRALNLHRDERRRAQILAQSAPSLERVAESRASQAGPEQAALLDEDRLIVREFLTELDELEQRVFWLIAEGMRYRAIAPALGIPVNEARNASRSCERKRERFQLLYDTGRLCGYREATIRALQDNKLRSEELARRAFAHLDSCAHCRAEHKTNAHRLRRTFHGQAAALLPLPALLGRLDWLRHPWLGARLHAQRTLARWASLGQGGGGVRERTVALVAAGGAGAKLTAGVVTVAVIAGGAIGATHALEHQPVRAHRHTAARPATVRTTGLSEGSPALQGDTGVLGARPRESTGRSRGSVHVATSRDQTASHRSGAGPEAAEREFGLPAAPSPPASTDQTPIRSAAGSQEAAEREFGLP